MKRSIIPSDSLLRDWISILSTTEIPLSYQVATGISAIGTLLKRQVWIDQHSYNDWGWNVYPNQSVMLIGPSGIGKDTAINFTVRFLEKLNIIPIFGGVTIENLYHRLVALGKPAAAYIPIGEMTNFFGNRDYQSGIVQGITDLLSTNEKMDVSTKGDLTFGGPKIIQQPTVTMHCGSTEEWLHKAMPDGSMEGGFLGRFLILVEKFSGKHVPFPRDALSGKLEQEKLGKAVKRWEEGVRNIVSECKGLGALTILEEAKHVYTNWYCNRFKRFSKAVLPYANRSRDTVLRLAMLMALSRGHFGWVDEIDIQFGIEIIDHIAKGIDNAILPPTVAAACAKEILSILPSTSREITQTFGRKYTLKQLQEAEELLRIRGDIERKGEKWVKTN